MTSIFQGEVLPDVTTKKTVTTTGPDWYNSYLQSLAKPGTDLLSKSGDQLVAPMSDLQKDVLKNAPGALSEYETLMDQASKDIQTAAKGMTPDMIQSFMNPYTTNVVNEMARLQQQNLTRNLMPSLRGAFAGTGGTGSQRMMGALGQLGSDVQANLLGAQTGALQKGYESALTAAGKQADLLRQGALSEKDIANADLQAAIDQLKTQYGFGEKEQQYEQSKILAPIAAAKSAADVFANIKVPSTVTEDYKGPMPGAYSTSPLATIAGLGSLFASGAGGTSAAKGFADAIKGISDWLNKEFQKDPTFGYQGDPLTGSGEGGDN